LHIDKAGENISAEVQAFCKDHGIALSTTATEQHQQNGIAERLNGIILKWLTATLASLNAKTPFLLCQSSTSGPEPQLSNRQDAIRSLVWPTT